jgi:pimeloyl-ACP methyl ester carboxylesterase
VAEALSALPTRAHRTAALAYYRSFARPGKPLPQYAELLAHHARVPIWPVLYLHGSVDGGVHPGLTRYLDSTLPPGSRVQIIPGAGHFVQLEQPALVAAQINEYLSSAVPS